ncbi:MAG: hypothetical protein IKJ32_03985 [Clostridia bacterium]|nr:hypothetical protein [Clostridia bacterium]
MKKSTCKPVWKLVTIVTVTLAALWLVSLIIPGLGIKIGATLGIICCAFSVLGVIAWKKNVGPIALLVAMVKKLFGKAAKKSEEKPKLPPKPAQNEAMKKKGLVWTWDGNDWVVEKDHSKEPVPAGKKYDAETNTFVDASAPSAPKPSADGRPEKPVLPKSMKDNGLVWTWNGTNWVPEEDHSTEPVPVGKVYDKETNTFVELGDVFTEAQMTVIKQIVAAEVKKATKKP